MRWSCPHPALIDVYGVYHHVHCPWVADGDDPDKHQHLAADEPRDYGTAPVRCRHCYPDLRNIGR